MVALLALVGCTGRLSAVGPGGQEGGQVDLDGGHVLLDGAVGHDASPVGEDASTSELDAATDAGMPDAGPPDPCAEVTCGTNARCVEGACECQPGFVDMGGVCTALPPGDPAGRTQTEVCDAWRAGRVENASPAWTAGSGTCSPGTMSSAAIDDTLRRVNMYRWLAGLPPVTHDASAHDEMMQCANMMSVNNDLSHEPPTSWTCYTSAGAGAAGRSNIALGYGTPGAAIAGYMSDRGTPSLGHRRWILSGRLGQVEIGFAAPERPGQCLGVFDSSGSTERPWTAYPNQGFAPVELAAHTWSFHVNAPIGLDTSATVDVVRVSDGASLAVDDYYIEGRGPPDSIGFTPDGWTPAAGETYRVTIHGTSMGDVTYEVHLVSC